MPHLQVEPADRQRIGRGAEIEIDVHATFHRGDEVAVEPPETGGVPDHLDLDVPLPDPARDQGREGPPLLVAGDRVVQPAGLALVAEDGGSNELPARSERGQAAGLVPGPVEPAPENGLSVPVHLSAPRTRLPPPPPRHTAGR